MAQANFQAVSSPAAVTTSAVVGYPAVAAEDLLLLYVASNGTSIDNPGNGFQLVGTASSATLNVAVFRKTATGSESGSITVATPAGTMGAAYMASYRPPVGSSAQPILITSGEDTDATSLALAATGASRAWATDDRIVAFALAETTAAFAGVLSGFSLSSAGSIMGTGATRVGGRTGTNRLAYNLYDRPLTAGAAGAPAYSANANGANATGLVVFVGVRVGAVNTPPTSAANVQVSAAAGSSYQASDASTPTMGGATIASRVWRIVSGGGSLSSTSASTVAVTAPATPGTQVIGIKATDSNGVSGAEATYAITITAGVVPDAGPDITTDRSARTIQVAAAGPTATQYQWRQVSGPKALLSDTATSTVSVDIPATVAGGVVFLGLRVGSGSGVTTDEDTMAITVLPHLEWALLGGHWSPITSALISSENV